MASSTTAYEPRRSSPPPEVLRLIITRGRNGAVHKLGTSPDPGHHVLAWLKGRETGPAVGIVRAQAAEFLTASRLNVQPELIDDVVLCTSEAVANALVHTESRIIAIRLTALADTVRGASVTAVVSDEDRTVPVERLFEPGDATATSGRGLACLTALSLWGCRRWEYGKDVWFTCPRPEPRHP
jgi:anti-sigma regulatory factor (Ser/Thr protein kinase)